MIQKKICMLGAFAVGKTSLVSRYVTSIFSDQYLSTVGVKIDKKLVTVDGQELTLMLWDIAGQDDYQTVQPSHLRGMAGYLLVADGTRWMTLDVARQLQEKAVSVAGPVPFILLLNKSDLSAEWEVDEKRLMALAELGWRVVRTSAKTGEGVEAAFELLARAMLGPRSSSPGERWPC
jgi:small GTP-binding protein